LPTAAPKGPRVVKQFITVKERRDFRAVEEQGKHEALTEFYDDLFNDEDLDHIILEWVWGE
jgi:hypothetical protein